MVTASYGYRRHATFSGAIEVVLTVQLHIRKLKVGEQQAHPICSKLLQSKTIA